MNSLTKTTGVALALAAASLAGCNSMSGDKMGAQKMAAKAENVHCFGVNKCKGHNDCKTASNACKSMASCKGQGFLSMSAKACDDVGGNTNG